MTAYPHLTKAPIQEAIIDIQGKWNVDTSPEKLLERLENLQPKFNGYSIKEPRLIRELNFNTQAQQMNFKEAMLGFLFKTSDGKRIVQVRVNGFTFSQLKPYESWDVLTAETSKLWKIFIAEMPDFLVNRIAVRFINRLLIPYPLDETEGYLKNVLPPPCDPPQRSKILSLQDQVTFVDTPSGATVGVVRVMKQPPKGALETEAFLDIDVFRLVNDLKPDKSEVFETIGKFREVKNRIFFSSVGNDIIKRYL